MPVFATPDLSDAAPEAQAVELPLQNYGGHSHFSGQAVTIK